MKSSRPKRVYWDTCLFIHLIEQTEESDLLVHCMEQAQEGALSIVTSMVTIAEVAFAETERHGHLDAEVERRIDSLWTPPSPVMLVEAHLPLMFRARDLSRSLLEQHGRTIRGLDLIHVATALSVGATELQTKDGPLKRKGQIIPGLRICEPYDPDTPLFDSSREGE